LKSFDDLAHMVPPIFKDVLARFFFRADNKQIGHLTPCRPFRTAASLCVTTGFFGQ
jgi:hypothetical protein